MSKLIMTLGLPASGKTTWAKEQVLKSNGRVKRVNKDDLRAMIDAGQWSKQNEKMILSFRDEMIHEILAAGYDVIVDDTNFGPHEATLRDIAERQHADSFEIKDFTDVPLQTCIDRDSARPNSVGEAVIKRMYNSFLKGKSHVAQYSPPPYNPDLPDCVIVDIDGTTAHMTDRSPYDYTRVSEDVVDEQVADLVRKYYRRDIQDLPETYVIIVSGRDDTCRGDTEKWLADNHIPYDELYMRDPNRVDSEGNKLDDTVIKREIYETWIKPRYNVRIVLDDRDRVVKMWRELGLKVLQVAEGNF